MCISIGHFICLHHIVDCIYFQGADSGNESFKHAKDRNEACSIGQELINCGLLVPICLPRDKHHHHHHQGNNINDDDDLVGVTRASLLTTTKPTTTAVATTAATTRDSLLTSKSNARDSMIGTGSSGGGASEREALNVTFADVRGYLYRWLLASQLWYSFLFLLLLYFIYFLFAVL